MKRRAFITLLGGHRLQQEKKQEEDSMLARTLAIGTAFIFIATAAPAVFAAQKNIGDTGGIKGSGPAARGSVQSHGRQKIQNLRGKRNPSDQGREH